jgi:uncharacterized membrane protein YdfJ with MMPL/SSD domain
MEESVNPESDTPTYRTDILNLSIAKAEEHIEAIRNRRMAQRRRFEDALRLKNAVLAEHLMEKLAKLLKSYEKKVERVNKLIDDMDDMIKKINLINIEAGELKHVDEQPTGGSGKANTPREEREDQGSVEEFYGTDNGSSIEDTGSSE